MKLIIAGGRELTPSFDFITSSIKMLRPGMITEVVSGGAFGVDAEGEHWASHMNVPVVRFKADWKSEGLSAGPKRNRKMAHYADALLLIWNGASKGSLSMKTEMLKLNKPVYEVIVRSVNV